MFRFDGYESKFYSDRINFSKLYPLVPYQVDLLKESLNAIWNSGYAWSHLSRGERSLLTFFKESIQSYKDESTWKIVSFADLYNALESRIETYIKSTIHSASELPWLPPRALDVLKVLFMLKYVRLVSLTTDNISTLLIQDVHEDMVVLKKQVEEALVFLEKHNYVNKWADAWEFLSNEEQEMERMISWTPIDELDVYAQVHDLVFATNQYWLANKYQHDKYHNVSFKKQIDEYEKVSIDSQLSVKLLRKNENTETDWFSFSAKQIRIVLPDNNIWELRNMISKCKKIEKFILQHNASDKNSDRITQKWREKELLMQKAIELLDDSLKESQIFLGAQELDLSWSSFKDRIHKALHSLFDTVYSEFWVLQKPYKDDDIKELLSRANKVATQEALMEDMSPNLAARDRISNHIIQQWSQSFNVTLKSLQEKFSSAPYWWSDSDISWILTELYLSKIVILKYDGKSIEVEDSRLVEYLTKSTHKERLLVNPKQAIDTRVVRDVSEAMSSLWMTVSNRAQEDQDELFKEILGWRSTTVSQLEWLLQQYWLRSYPWKEKIESFHQLVNWISPYLEQQWLFDSILEQSSSLLEAKNSATMVIQFFDWKQKDIFISWLESVWRYNSISTLLNEDSKSTLQQLSEILQKEEPYSDIPQIKQLVNKLDASYQEILESKRSSTKERADWLVDQLLEIWNLDKDLKANVEDKLDSLLYQPIANTKEIAELMTIHDQLPKMVEQVQSIISSAEKESWNVVASATVNKRTVKLLSLQKMPHSIKTEEDVATFTDNIANQLRKELKDWDIIVII